MYTTFDGEKVSTLEELQGLRKSQLKSFLRDRQLPEIEGETKSEMAQRLFDIGLATVGVGVNEIPEGEEVDEVTDAPVSVEPEPVKVKASSFHELPVVKQAIAAGVGVQVDGDVAYFGANGLKAAINIRDKAVERLAYRAIRYVTGK